MPTYRNESQGKCLGRENVTHSVIQAMTSLDSCTPTSLAGLTATTLDLSSSATRTLGPSTSDQLVQREMNSQPSKYVSWQILGHCRLLDRG